MRLLLLFVAILTSVQAFAAEPNISYEEHIKPIFRENCLKCHGEDEHKAGLNLSTHANVLKGGSGGAAVVAGRASASLIYQAITDADADSRMPPKKPPLPAAQIELIRSWIQSGLRENSRSESLSAARDIGFKPVANAGGKTDGPPPMPENLPAFTPVTTSRPLPIVAMSASPTAPLLAVAGHEHVRLIDLTNQKIIGALPFPEGQPNIIRFSHNGRVLMVAGGKPVQSGCVVLFDVRSGKRLTSIGDETDAVLAADISPDQKLIALGGSGKVVKVYGTDDRKLRYKLTKHTDWITAIAFSPDGSRLASADRAGAVQLWDSASGGILLTLSEHKAAVRALAWRGDSHMLASGGEDGQLIWWDAHDGWPAIINNNAHPPARPEGVYGKIPNGVLAVAFGSAGELISAGRDRLVRLWAADGKALQSFRNDASLPLQAVISQDGKLFVGGDAAGEVHFWTKNSK